MKQFNLTFFAKVIFLSKKASFFDINLSTSNYTFLKEHVFYYFLEFLLGIQRISFA